jgi:hypothetical protein
MRAINSRKALKEINRSCKRRGIEFEIDRDRGPGSHQGLRYRDPASRQDVGVVIPGHKEISPGVQRAVIEYFRSIAPRAPLADVVRSILHEVFD